MPNPTKSDVHVNRPLTNISIAYAQDARDFIADRVFPTIPVDRRSDRYIVYPKDQWFRSDMQPRGLSQESAGSGFGIDNTPTYYCKLQALHKDIDDRLRPDADPPINMDSDATEFVTQQALLRREKDWAAKYFVTSTWTGSSTGGDITPGTKWSTTGSTPISDMRTQMGAQKKKTGRRPNKLVLAEDVWDILQDHADVLDRIKLSSDKVFTTALLARLLELDEVLIAGAVENTANEGATAAMDWVYSKAAALYYAAPKPSLMKPSAGYTFAWKGYLGASNKGTRIKKFRMEPIASDRIEIESAYDQKLIASDLGVFFDAVIA